MTRRLLLSYLSLAALVLVCLEIPLGFVYSRSERERVVLRQSLAPQPAVREAT